MTNIETGMGMDAPHSRKANRMAVEYATLRQCILWVAFGLEPIEPRFEVLERYQYVYPDTQLLSLPKEQQEPQLQAEERIARSLMLGDQKAFGRPAEVMSEGSLAAIAGQEQTEIPKESWHLYDIDWMAAWQRRIEEPRPDVDAYVDVVVKVEMPKRVLPPSRIPKVAEAVRKGRPPKYDELDFLRLCVWEAQTNRLPQTQADFSTRMSEVVGVLRGEDRVPGETRLKQIISDIYKVRADYERARRAIRDS